MITLFFLFFKGHCCHSNVEEDCYEKKYKLFKKYFETIKDSWIQEKNAILEDRSIRNEEFKAQIKENESQQELLFAQ